ncbi:MAG: hypothetical protein IM674_05575 [Brevundimonas sp.]|nr:hypothetical protein [Brevundimonas sp.]
MPMLAESAEDALDALEETFFPTRQVRSSGDPTKHTVKKSIRQALTRNQIEKNTGYHEMAPVRWREVPTKIDFTVSNGCVRALIQGFSLYQDNPEAVRNEVRSWAWMMGHLMRDGGVMIGRREDKDVEIEIPKGVRAFAVCAAPPNASELTEDLLEEARQVIASEGAEFHDIGDANSVAATAKALIAQH